MLVEVAVEMSLADGVLVISRITPPQYTLEGLLEGVTDENLHGEVETGPAVGDEVW